MRPDNARQTIVPAIAAISSLFVFALSANLLPAVLLRASADMEVAARSLAVVYSVQFIAFFLTAATAGIVADRAGKKGVFVCACVLLLVGAFVWGTARHFSQACAAAALWGAAGGILEGMSSALLCDLFPHRRKLFMNISQVVYTIGAVGGPWLAGMLLPAGVDWRVLFVGVGALSALLLVLYLLCHLPPPEPHERPALNRLWPVIRSWSFAVPCVAIFIYVTLESSVVVYANLYLREAHAAPENWAIYSISLFWFAMMIGRVGCAMLPEHHSYEKTIALLLTLFGVTLALQGVVGSWEASMAVFALTGLASAGAWPLIVGLASSKSGAHSASVVGLTVAVGSLGCVAAPPLVNALMAIVPLKLVFTVLSLPAFLAALLVFVAFRSATVAKAHDGERDHV